MFKKIFIILVSVFIFSQYIGISHGASSGNGSKNSYSNLYSDAKKFVLRAKKLEQKNKKMKIIKNILLIITVSFFIYSCEGFKLKKKSTSGEEFLIEKKDPLILPPDFSKLPEPNEQIENQDNEEEKLVIDNVFNEGNQKNDENDNKEINQKSDLKKSILEKIK